MKINTVLLITLDNSGQVMAQIQSGIVPFPRIIKVSSPQALETAWNDQENNEIFYDSVYSVCINKELAEKMKELGIKDGINVKAKKIIVVQSIPVVLELVKDKISSTFPNLDNQVVYQSDFEKTLREIPKDEEIIVVASDSYHDDENILFESAEKNGNKLAEEIKKINPMAKVYIFSMYEPKREYIDGFYQKSQMGDNTLEEIIEIFVDLGLSQ